MAGYEQASQFLILPVDGQWNEHRNTFW
jgi:hypothetical protein